MKQLDIVIQVQYDSTLQLILFSSESPYFEPVQGGSRALIKVPNCDQEVTTITLQLSGGGAFPEADAAVQWTHPKQPLEGSPTWAKVERSSANEVKIRDTWQERKEDPKDARFTVGVFVDGGIINSEDPTIIHNPENG